jgi:hypothetical protein
VIITDKKIDRHVVIWYKIIGNPSLTTNIMILFYAGISALEKRVRFIFELPTYLTG